MFLPLFLANSSMFFSKVFLFAIILGATSISVFANPLALNHHALHRRTFAARVASNSSDTAVIRQDSSDSDSDSDSTYLAHTGIAQNTPDTRSPKSPTATNISNATQSPVSFTSRKVQGIGPFNGQGTFYNTGLGACGVVSKDTDHLVAVSHLLFDNFPGKKGTNPNKNPICHKLISITFKGRTISDVPVLDRCVGCAYNDVDMSPSTMKAIDPNFLLDGRISGVHWNFQ